MTPEKQPPRVTQSVALALVRYHLAGLRDYPLHEDGQNCLARHVAESALSVEHAQAILQTFRQLCPTPQEIHDVAWNPTTRARFMPPPEPLRKQWEAAGATLDPGFYERIHAEAFNRAPGESREIDRMYKAVGEKLNCRSWQDWSRVSWGAIFSTARSLGFPLNSEQQEFAAQWERTQPKSETRPAGQEQQAVNAPPSKVLTAADLEAAREKYRREKQKQQEPPQES